MGFAENWERKEPNPGVMDRLRNRVTTPLPLKTQIELASREIRLLITQLDGAVSRIKQRDATIFKSVVAALAKRDSQHAAIYANELTEVRKMGKTITQFQLALEQISLRLNTLTDLGEIASALAPAVSVVRSMKNSLGTVLPQADREIGEISGLLSNVLIDAGTTGGLSLNFDVANEDAQKVLDEAATVAEERMRDSFPEIPASIVSEPEQEQEGLSA